MVLHARFQCVGSIAAKRQYLLQERLVLRVARCLAKLQFLQKRCVAQSGADLGFGNDGGQLGSAQHRHGRHHHQTRLQRAQEAGGHHGRVGAAQQEPIARHQTHVLGQHLRNAMAVVAQLGIGPGDFHRPRRAWRDAANGNAMTPTLCHMAVYQFSAAIEDGGVVQFG